MPPPRSYLTDADRRVLQDALDVARRHRVNPSLREDDTSGRYLGPEVHAAWVDAGGIPALSEITFVGTGTFPPEAVPGEAECRICAVEDGEIVQNVPHIAGVAGFTEIVRNLRTVAIEGNQWILVVRDKYGCWWALPLPLQQAGTGTGTGTGNDSACCDVDFGDSPPVDPPINQTIVNFYYDRTLNALWVWNPVTNKWSTAYYLDTATNILYVWNVATLSWVAFCPCISSCPDNHWTEHRPVCENEILWVYVRTWTQSYATGCPVTTASAWVRSYVAACCKCETPPSCCPDDAPPEFPGGLLGTLQAVTAECLCVDGVELALISSDGASIDGSVTSFCSDGMLDMQVHIECVNGIWTLTGTLESAENLGCSLSFTVEALIDQDHGLTCHPVDMWFEIVDWPKTCCGEGAGVAAVYLHVTEIP